MNGKQIRTLAVLGKVQWRKAKAIIFVRGTCDSHGQGVHEEQAVSNESFPGSERVATNISPLQECQAPDLGGSHGSVSCSEWLARTGSSNSSLAGFACLRLCR